ncbi:MAG: DNA topology modulation protein FlaR, partial [Streptococcus sp.]|nr:DNA topology modulation protein FlaR [Streptococcus sp.]
MKIAIIGYSSSGKSTLASFLGQHYNCEVLHLDKIHFTSNWKERTVNEMTDDISKFMLQKDWIIEGNYSACLYEERMREADCIIYFNFNRVNCLYRAFRRYLKYKGRTRPSMAENC